MARRKKAAPKAKKKIGELEGTLNEVRKRYGDTSVRKGSQILQPDRISTGVFVLDFSTLGGIGCSRSSHVVGERHAGKSMLSNKLIANAQRQFRDQKVILLDTEGTFEGVWAEKLGVDLDELEVIECETGEMALDIADAVLQSVETSLVVIDSIAAMEPMKERESSAEDHLVAFHAKLIAEFVRKTTSIMIEERRRGHNVTLLNLNQFRSDIGGYGMNPRKIPGGRALGHSTSFDVIMKNKENKGNDVNSIETITHNTHTYTITKNKMNNGPRTGEFILIREPDDVKGLDVGDVDDSTTVFSVAKKFGFVGGAGKNQWMEFLDYKTKFSLQDNAIQMLREEKDLYWKLRTHIIRKQAERLGMPNEFIRRII